MATCSFCGGNVIFVNPIGDDDAIRNDVICAECQSCHTVTPMVSAATFLWSQPSDAPTKPARNIGNWQCYICNQRFTHKDMLDQHLRFYSRYLAKSII